MNKVILGVLVMAACVFGQGASLANNTDLNTNGWLDTAIIWACPDSGAYTYTKPFALSRGEDCRVTLMISDTSSAGFASDTPQVSYGYQSGHLVLNNSAVKDTAWMPRVFLDSMTTAKIGTVGDGTTDSTGMLALAGKWVDTTYVSGYMVQSSWFVPPWDEMVRFWIKGLANGNGTDKNKHVFVFKRRRGVDTRGR